MIRPIRHADARGWFSETYSVERLRKVGVTEAFVQDNQSWSRVSGTVRGLHFQRPPTAQAKLVSCLVGTILDRIVDIRAGSPTFGQGVSVRLSDQGEQLFVPEGFAHGFVTLSDAALVSYKVTRPYDPAAEDGVAWPNPLLHAGLAATVKVVISDRDAALRPLSDIHTPFEWVSGGLTPVDV